MTFFSTDVYLVLLFDSQVEDFLKILHEVDKTLAGDLETSFPSLKVQT